MPRKLWWALLVGVLIAKVAAAADAPNTSVHYAQCIANAGASSCDDPSIDALEGVASIAQSPDGGTVYALSMDAVSWFDPQSDGRLDFEGCVAPDGMHGCESVSANAFQFPSSIAVSPDGAFLYLATHLGQSASVLTFAIDPGGALTYQGCLANRGAFGCAGPGRNSLVSLQDIAVSPDGKTLYAVGGIAVTALSGAESGELHFAECVANRGAFGCERPTHNSLGGIGSGLAISPDGRSIYAGSLLGRRFTHLRRTSNDLLSYRGCFANLGRRGCRSPKRDSLESSTGLAVSADGRWLYVASDGALTRFRRRTRGGLKFRNCFADEPTRFVRGVEGCRTIRHPSLHSGTAVAVSSNGRWIYSIGLTGRTLNGGPGALSVFRLRGQRMKFVGCYVNDGRRGCRRLPRGSMSAPLQLSLSPDEASLYVAASESIAVFARGP